MRPLRYFANFIGVIMMAVFILKHHYLLEIHTMYFTHKLIQLLPYNYLTCLGNWGSKISCMSMILWWPGSRNMGLNCTITSSFSTFESFRVRVKKKILSALLKIFLFNFTPLPDFGSVYKRCLITAFIYPIMTAFIFFKIYAIAWTVLLTLVDTTTSPQRFLQRITC